MTRDTWLGRRPLTRSPRRLEPGADFGREVRRHDEESLYRGYDVGLGAEADVGWGQERFRGTRRGRGRRRPRRRAESEEPRGGPARYPPYGAYGPEYRPYPDGYRRRPAPYGREYPPAGRGYGRYGVRRRPPRGGPRAPLEREYGW